LQAWLNFFCVVVGTFEAQTFDNETRATKATGDLRLDFIISEKNDFDACIDERRDDVALQEVNDCHAVVGGDEDSLGQE
jgi:hypothetical protein